MLSSKIWRIYPPGAAGPVISWVVAPLPASSALSAIKVIGLGCSSANPRPMSELPRLMVRSLRQDIYQEFATPIGFGSFFAYPSLNAQKKRGDDDEMMTHPRIERGVSVSPLRSTSIL
jgi:hypothetical protein